MGDKMLKKLFFNLLIILALCTPTAIKTKNINKLESTVATWLNISSIKLKELSGGLTNRTFLGHDKDKSYIVRIGKSEPEILGIDRFRESACQRDASKIGIAPEILYEDPKNGNLVSAFIKGKTLTQKSISDVKKLTKIIEAIKKCHAMPFKKAYAAPSIFDEVRRLISRSLKNKECLISEKEAKKVKALIKKIEAYFTGKKYEGLCHCDFIAGNFIDDGKKLWLIDWEYAGWGNILFDLASFCIEQNLTKKTTESVLNLYFGKNWEDHYLHFKLICALFELRNAFWYDLRSKDEILPDNCDMEGHAKRHYKSFWKRAKALKLK